MGLMKGEAAEDFVDRLRGDSAEVEAALGVDDLGMKDEDPLLAGILVISTRSTEGVVLAEDAAEVGLLRSIVSPAGIGGGVDSLDELETLAAKLA